MKEEYHKHHRAIAYCAGYAFGLHYSHITENIVLVETRDLEHIIYTIIFEYCREMGIGFICPNNEFYELLFCHMDGFLDDRHFEPDLIHYCNFTIDGLLKWAEVLVLVWLQYKRSAPISESVIGTNTGLGK